MRWRRAQSAIGGSENVGANVEIADRSALAVRRRRRRRPSPSGRQLVGPRGRDLGSSRPAAFERCRGRFRRCAYSDKAVERRSQLTPQPLPSAGRTSLHEPVARPTESASTTSFAERASTFRAERHLVSGKVMRRSRGSRDLCSSETSSAWCGSNVVVGHNDSAEASSSNSSPTGPTIVGYAALDQFRQQLHGWRVPLLPRVLPPG